MFPGGWFRDILLQVSAKMGRDKAEAGSEREREEHRIGAASPSLAMGPIKVWSRHFSWFSFNPNPFYCNIICKELCFVIKPEKAHPTVFLMHRSELKYLCKEVRHVPCLGFGKPCFGPRLQGCTMNFMSLRLYKHHHNLGNGCLPGCKFAVAIPGGPAL